MVLIHGQILPVLVLIILRQGLARKGIVKATGLVTKQGGLSQTGGMGEGHFVTTADRVSPSRHSVTLGEGATDLKSDSKFE